MNKSLTVVLPIHNGEHYIRSSINDLLDVAQEMTTRFDLVIVDDASTDETYETACEMSRMYPQLTVLRQSVQQGLSAALALVRNRMSPDVVVVHDGVTAINAEELRTLLKSDPLGNSASNNEKIPTEKSLDSAGSRRFGALRGLQENMERVHRRVTGFRWIKLEKPLVPRRSSVNFAPAFASAAPIAPTSFVIDTSIH